MREIIEKFLRDEGMGYCAIDPKTIVFRTEFLEKCQMNYCGRYNRSWSCPPAIGDVAEIQKKTVSYPEGFLFQMVFPLEDDYDVEGMDKGRSVIMKKTLKLNSLLQKTKADFLLLSAGSCMICEHCTYPDKPCRHKDMLLVSMEALGIDVSVIARAGGLRYYHGPRTVTYFSLCCFREPEHA